MTETAELRKQLNPGGFIYLSFPRTNESYMWISICLYMCKMIIRIGNTIPTKDEIFQQSVFDIM